MRTIIKSGSARLYFVIGALGVIAVGWKAGETVNLRLDTLEVHKAPRVDRNSAPIDKKSFYPVWVKQAIAKPPVVADAGGVEQLFGNKPDEASKAGSPEQLKPVEPDYSDAFKQAARIDGVADNGAFINGQFHKVGEKMEAFTYGAPNEKQTVAVLESIKDGKMTFAIGKTKVVFLVGE